MQPQMGDPGSLRVWLGVRLASFANLDLLQQGTYRVRCALLLRGPADGARGRALAPEYTFRGAEIHFIDQEVELGELAQFEAVVPRGGTRACYLDFELLFQEAPLSGVSRSATEVTGGAESLGQQGPGRRAERVVARETFHIRDLGEVVCEYTPLHFDRFHLALADLLVAAAPLEATSEEASFSGRALDGGQTAQEALVGVPAVWGSAGQLFFGGCCSSGGEGAPHCADRCACALAVAGGQSGGGGGGGFSDIGFETHEGLRRSLSDALKLLEGLLGEGCDVGRRAEGREVDDMGAPLSELAARCTRSLQREIFSGSDVLHCSKVFSGVLRGLLVKEIPELLGLLRGVWVGRRGDVWGKYLEGQGSLPRPASGALTVPDGAAELQLHDLRFEAPSSEVPVCRVEQYLSGAEGSDKKAANGPAAETCDGPEGRHVVVFVHGFQGDALDHRVVKGYLRAAHPEIHYLMSRANIEFQYDGFEEMGARLAEEVASYLNSVHAEHLSSLRLSFVAHSVGCIVVRAALLQPALQEFRPRLGTFMSLCGPHLGLAGANNTLLTSGMKVLQHVKQAKWISQALLEDAEVPEKGFLHRLAREAGLGEFRNVLLLGSRQDRYVPYYSTMVDAEGADAAAEPQLRNAAGLILRGAGSKGRKLLRLHVQYSEAPFRAIDNFIGRAAHVAFLEDDLYIRVVAWNIVRAHRLL